VLTANGARHLRQRRLLLPPFHGEAIERYARMIADVANREIDRWPIGRPVALAPRMQAITLDVIMGGILGIEGKPHRGTPEWGLRAAVKQLAMASTQPIGQLGMLMNVGRDEPIGIMRAGLEILDRCTYALIASRRRAADFEGRTDILSLIMRATTEDGEPLTDRELRDELLTLILAGFETTANQLAWTWERLVRNPIAHERLRSAVRSGEAVDAHIEATITESMRCRPVIPAIGRRVLVPWRLGDYAMPADTPIVMSILLLHHRPDLYPDPFAFRPERWLERKQPDDPGDARSGEAGRRAGVKPGTYEWIPFGGGTRRCLGAALAMAEQRVVLRTMVDRLDIVADDAEPERARDRNVTMIPARGARVTITSRRAAGVTI
jgi:cytochrome P450